MGIMEISPSEFWAMTPNDFWAIYEARYGKLHKPLTREELNEMMAKCPDK